MEGGDVNIVNEENIKLEPKDSHATSQAKQTLVESVPSEGTSASSLSQKIPIIDAGDELHTESNNVVNTRTKKNVPFVSTKRKRELVKRVSRANNADSFEGSWSEVDKQRLLIALQRFGVMDMDNLTKAVPGRSEEDIKKYINFKWKMIRTELRSRLKETRKLRGDKSPYLGPVDKWLEILENALPKLDHYKTNPLAHAVLLIWKYEKHPDPSECGGVDFKALYEYLYYMLSGFPPKHLNQPTAAYLSTSLKNFACGIKNDDSNIVTQFLTAPVTVNFPKKKDINEEDIPSALSFTKEQCLDELIKLPGFNPFCVPRDHLKKKVLVTVEDNSCTVACSSSVTAAPSPSTTTVSSISSATVYPTASTSSKATVIPVAASTSSKVTVIPVAASTSSKATVIPVAASTSSKTTVIPVAASTSSRTTVIPVVASTSSKATSISVAVSTSSKATATPVAASSSSKRTIIPVTASTSSTPTVIPVTASTFRKRTVIPVTGPPPGKCTIIPVVASTSDNGTITLVPASTSRKSTIIPVTASTSNTPTVIPVTASTSNTPTVIPVTASTSNAPTVILATASTSTTAFTIPATATSSITSSTIPAVAAAASLCTSTSGAQTGRIYRRTISEVSNASRIITEVSTTTPSASATPRRSSRTFSKSPKITTTKK